jgi:hypothetical protein
MHNSNHFPRRATLDNNRGLVLSRASDRNPLQSITPNSRSFVNAHPSILPLQIELSRWNLHLKGK